MKNVFLKHVRYRDVCIFVPFIRLFNGTIKSKGEFWNQIGYPMHIATKVEIAKEEQELWLWGYSAKGPWKSFNAYR